jgi:hypothetical protein
MALKRGVKLTPTNLDEFPEVPETIPRDRWDRPLIVPPGGGKPIAYTRASTLGKAIEDTYHLNRWMLRCVAYGLSRRPDLVALAASIATNEGDDRAPLDEICNKAHEAAKGDKGANVGTALHKLSERRDAGEDLAYLTPELAEAIDAYGQQMKIFEVLAAETFVVCDPLQAAGSFDRVVRLLVDLEFHHAKLGRTVIPAGTVLVLDLKTGKLDSAKYWGPTYGVQQTVYACGSPYQHPRGRLDWEEVLGAGVRPSTDWALILHVPSDSPKDAGLVMVDLSIGAVLAELAVEVRQGRKAKGLLSECHPAQLQVSNVTVEAEVVTARAEVVTIQCGSCGQVNGHIPECVEVVEVSGLARGPAARLNALAESPQVKLLAQIQIAPSGEALSALWEANQDVWTDAHSAAAREREAELTAEPAQVAKLDLIAQLRAAPDEAALNTLWEANQQVWNDDATRMARARAAELRAVTAG